MLLKMSPPLLLTAFFILSLLCSPASPQHPTASKNNSRLLKLAIFWPTSLCNGKTKCHNTPPNRFTIHGPWSLYKDPPGPEAVDWSTFPVATEDKMKTDWASYVINTNRQFWDHEWSKHGRVSGLQPPAYFQLGLALFYRVDLGNHLKSEGVYPTGQTVENRDFKAAVSKAAGGKTVVLLCNKDKEGVAQLFEIRICLDLATPAHAYVNCRGGFKFKCPDHFRLTKAATFSSDSSVHSEL